MAPRKILSQSCDVLYVFCVFFAICACFQQNFYFWTIGYVLVQLSISNKKLKYDEIANKNLFWQHY